MTAPHRRRWTVRVRDVNGEEVWLVISVPEGGDGTIHASVGETAVAYQPTDVAKLREIYRDALVIALQDRGGW